MAGRHAAALALSVLALAAPGADAERWSGIEGFDLEPPEAIAAADAEQPLALTREAPVRPHSPGEASLLERASPSSGLELGPGNNYRYLMLRLEEEAYFEKKSLCQVNRGADKNDGVAEALHVDLTTVKIVSIGSTSTQAYTCHHFVHGFWTGTQPESLRNPEELPRIGKWLANTTTAAEHVYLIGGPGWTVPDDEKAVSMAPRVYPNPSLDMTTCSWNRDETPEPLPVGETVLTPDVANGLIGQYQDVLCREHCKGSVYLVDKKHDPEKHYQLNNAWTDAIKITPGFAEYKTIVDWGGSGPKPVGGAMIKINGGTVTPNNNYLVDQPEGGPDRLNCNRLKNALTEVMAWLKANREGPYLIAQTGYAREKWVKTKTIQYVKNGALVDVGKENDEGVSIVLDQPCNFGVEMDSETVPVPQLTDRGGKFLLEDITDWVAHGPKFLF